MSRLRKRYGTSAAVKGGMPHQKRGGVPGVCVDSGFGSKTNLNRSKKLYTSRKQLEK